MILSRSLGLEAAPCSLQVAWARSLSCPARLRHRVAVWPHSAPYPSLCAWHSPRDPTPWEFSCQWRLLLAQSGPLPRVCSASGVPSGRLGHGGRRLLSLRPVSVAPASPPIPPFPRSTCARLFSLSCLTPPPEQELQEAEGEPLIHCCSPAEASAQNQAGRP